MKRKAVIKPPETVDSEKLLDSLLSQCPDSANPDQQYCCGCLDKSAQALSIARAASLPDKVMEILHRLANCNLILNNIDLAMQYAAELLALHQAGQSFSKINHLLFIYARMYWIKGAYETAVTHYLEALKLYEAEDNLPLVSGVCMNLSSIMRIMGKIDASIEYINKGIRGFEQLHDTAAVFRAKSNLANIYYSQNLYSLALELKFEIIDYFTTLNNQKQLALEYNTVSVIYHRMSRLDKAIDFALKSVQIREVLNDQANIAQSWINLGVYYNEFGNSKVARDYYAKALEYYTRIGDKSSMSSLYNNIGNIYLKGEEHPLAMEYYQKSFAIAEEINDKCMMATALENIGGIYSDHFHEVGKALEVYNQAAILAEQAQDLFLYVSIQIMIIELKNNQGDYAAALEMLQPVEQLIREHKLEKLYVQIYSLYVDNYAGTGAYKEALEASRHYCEERDKSYQAESIAKIAEMQTKYETEKKEKEAEILRQKNQELEAKNRLIEEQKTQLQDTLDKLQNSEIRYNFVSEELTKNIRTTLIGKSEAIRNIVEMISLVARSEKTNVLITGETGTGKEIVARNIHACSKRSKSPFYAVNCSAVPETLFESQFFGHEKDAFTGAVSTKIGWFEIADKSTLFLDEVCSLSLEQQAKLLRVLEERTIVRVGSHREIPIDVRIISAANVNLTEKVNAGMFRRDLYHRLAIFVINIPPLRERKEEIPLLLNHFIGLTATSMNKVIHKVEKDIAFKLLDYSFPGNVRELKNMVERAVLIAHTSTLRLEHFMIPLGEGNATSAPNQIETSDMQLPDILPLDELERQMIIKTLRKTGFNRVQAAKLLNVERKVIERKIKKYGITEQDV